MEYMLLFFLPLWLFLLIISNFLKNPFVIFFSFCQFIFIGFGLVFFGYSDKEYLSYLFPSFDFSGLSDWHFIKASFIVFLGTFVVVALSFPLGMNVKSVRANELNYKVDNIRKYLFLFLSLLVVWCCFIFVVDNLLPMFQLLYASSNSDLSSALDMRVAATSNYFLILVVYNLAPALALVSLIVYRENKTIINGFVFYTLIFLVFLCLLLTFQKRPLIVFLGAVIVAFQLSSVNEINISSISYIHILRGIWKYILLLLLLLIGLYYFYTAYRFELDNSSMLIKLLEVVGSRIFGRLSLPAAMYVDYFPRIDDFYGLSNVGLFSRIFDSELFRDTTRVFLYYSTSGLDGSVAASVFIDAYGQGGWLFVLFYSLVVTFILNLLNLLFFKERNGLSKVLLFLFSCIFIYYLSQASLFRSMLGYGGIIYFLVWFVSLKRRSILIGS
ncbi:hypothetical protein [Endozoicomonas sp. ALB032]|uniref:hypothetical protein n=1 Tax=Endozoicomonas sp. ALB032 TaxID=3403082 RepID=UPI003BB7C7B2